MPFFPLCSKGIRKVTVRNEIAKVVNPVGADGVDLSDIYIIATTRSDCSNKFIGHLFDIKALNQIIKVQINGERL